MRKLGPHSDSSSCKQYSSNDSSGKLWPRNLCRLRGSNARQLQLQPAHTTSSALEHNVRAPSQCDICHTSSPACIPCIIQKVVKANHVSASPVVNRACLVVHVHQLCGKLWDVLLGSVCFPMAIHMDVVSDVVVVNGVSTKL